MSRTLRNDVMKNRKMLKGSELVIREDLTLKNAKLLEDASAVPNVKAAWSDQGKVLSCCWTQTIWSVNVCFGV